MAQPLLAIPLDISPIAPPLLFQGSRPPLGSALRLAGIDVLVLCDNDFQPRSPEFDGVHVIHAPMRDEFVPLRQDNWEQARDASLAAAQLMRRNGARVLTTCRMGWNRSAFVNALILHRTLGMSGRQAVALIKARRPRTLQNPHFVRALEQIQEPKPRPSSGRRR